MAELSRVVVIVADGLGVGELPDAKEFGDVGSNTLRNVASHVGRLSLPNLARLGLGHLGNFPGIPKEQPLALVGRLAEKSAGKDTSTGHWEIAGVHTSTPFPLFPNGFPKELIQKFSELAQLDGVLGNRAASGTEIIQELGAEHLSTGKPILYTSGDSVFQLAAHEGKFGLDRLYKICEVARELTLPLQIGRIIARPFVGDTANGFTRTERRRDYSISPPYNALDAVKGKDIKVCGVGKIEDIFAHRGLNESDHTGNNADGLRATLNFLETNRKQKTFIFSNLVDFDQLYGHRRNPKGFAEALVEFDNYLPNLLKELTRDDMLIITGDHGCDPTFKGTDHTREYVPLIAFRPGHRGANLGDRESFADIGATLLEGFAMGAAELKLLGSSFLCDFKTS